MDYSRPTCADKLAADYVLGTLRGRARRRFEALLPAHPELRRAVARWHDLLMPLAAAVPPLAPSAQTWQRIEERLFERGAAAPAPPAGTTAAAGSGLLQRLAVQARRRLWLPVLAGALLALLPAALLLGSGGHEVPLACVLTQGNGVPSFVLSVDADGRSMRVTPLGGVTVDAGQELELWQVTSQGTSRSLGIVSASQATELRRRQRLSEAAGYALSLEPRGGSPSGSPTGPVVSTGRLRR
jgi:anti-sigma-K factor RskA